MKESLCPNKDVCGSCGWSHIPYEKQLAQKLSDINGSFALHNLSERCGTIHPSPRTTHYRNRMDFVIDFEGRVGLRQKGKWWKVIDNHTCFLADSPIEEEFHRIRNWTTQAGLSFYDRKQFKGFLRYAVIRSTLDAKIMTILVTSNPDSEDDVGKLSTVLDASKAEEVVWSRSHGTSDISIGDELSFLRGQGYLEESIAGITYKVAPHAFFQTNSYASPLLLNHVMELIQSLETTTVLDLYCGSGFFSLPLAREGRKVFGVELFEPAIEDARWNAQTNNIHAEFVAAKSEDYPWEEVGADCIILDPPRSGMHDRALERIISYAPKSIVYVSCNYKQLTRESMRLFELYDLANIEAFDLFPHTPHVETVALLKRKQ